MDIEQTTLLQTRLELETTRREIAESRLAHHQLLVELREAKITRLHEEANERREKAQALQELYSSEHYRNGEAFDAQHKAEHGRNRARIEELWSENQTLRAALELKEKEVCVLKGGC